MIPETIHSITDRQCSCKFYVDKKYRKTTYGVERVSLCVVLVFYSNLNCVNTLNRDSARVVMQIGDVFDKQSASFWEIFCGWNDWMRWASLTSHKLKWMRSTRDNTP
jgi:hypothetical protein